ncbi:MAG: PQQ-dependent sugar dehydrogenase [Opitutia bacterium]
MRRLVLALGAITFSQAAAYELEDAFGLPFRMPLGVVSVPGDKSKIFVVGKEGTVDVVTLGARPSKSTFLDLTRPRDGELVTTGESGLLGLAFPPDHARSGQFYVYYSISLQGRLHQRLSRFRVQPGGARADPASEQPLISQEDPAPYHNGGDLHFGPDGMLYFSTGDGGAGGDKHSGLLDGGFFCGIFRINPAPGAGLPPNPHEAVHRDAAGRAGYSIPKDNPHLRTDQYRGARINPAALRTEYWASGFRNVWRFSFDPKDGRCFAGDVGEKDREEIDLVRPGADHGWNDLEGSIKNPSDWRRNRPAVKYASPIFDYGRDLGGCVIGGEVYRGKALPELEGAYVFADATGSKIVALREKQGKWSHEVLLREPMVSAIGVEPGSGELLFASMPSGRIKRLVR